MRLVDTFSLPVVVILLFCPRVNYGKQIIKQFLEKEMPEMSQQKFINEQIFFTHPYQLVSDHT